MLSGPIGLAEISQQKAGCGQQIEMPFQSRFQRPHPVDQGCHFCPRFMRKEQRNPVKLFMSAWIWFLKLRDEQRALAGLVLKEPPWPPA